MAASLVVHVQKSVRATLPASWFRSVLQEAGRDPAVAARLPGLAASEMASADATASPELTVRVVGGRAIRDLHRRFFDDPSETDVLSFPSGTAAEDGYLGDLAVCWPVVVRQAARYGHDQPTEAALLVVHGLLHLLGWDHGTPAEEREMTALARRALQRSGLEPAEERLPER